MTVNAARRPRRRAAAPPPEPIVVPAESIAIGEIDQTVFDCPACGRPLAMGTRRCPGCKTRLIIGVPMSKAAVIAAGGLVVGLLVGGATGAVFGFLSRPVVVTPAPVVLPSVAPVGGASGGTLATPVPIPSAPTGGGSTGAGAMPAIARSALTQAVTVNDHLGAASSSLSVALAASSFDPSDVAQILRAISAESVYGEQLAAKVASWSDSAALGQRLTGLYGAIHDTAGEGLLASVRNEAAYRKSARTMVTLLAGLRSVDAELRALAEANGVTLPGTAP
jgi:hypothetical protein